jgi:hypothetical protein
MSHLLDEQRLSLAALARREGVAVSTIWRWTLRGCRGVKLESFSIGAKRFTTAEAFGRFVAATTAIAQGDPAPSPTARTDRQREAAIRSAEAELAEAGV